MRDGSCGKDGKEKAFSVETSLCLENARSTS